MFHRMLPILCTISTITVFCQNLDYGDYCTVSGKPGICKEFADCPAARIDYNNQLPLVLCRGRFPQLVCCSVENEDVEPPCPTHTQEYLKIQKDGRGKARDHCIDWLELTRPCINEAPIPGRRPDKIRIDECSRSRTKLIIDGKPADPGEFPHQVLLGFTPENHKVYWDCGGTLISDQWVLTAAHCTYQKHRGSEPIKNITKAKMGVIDEDETLSDYDYDIIEIRKYPSYGQNGVYHDIALLKLNKKVKLSKHVIPACLDYEGLQPKYAIATGFGITDETDHDSKSKTLLKVSLESFDYASCENSHPISWQLNKGISRQTHICFGSTTGNEDTCWGDSGGPLQVSNNNVYCIYTVIGVTSFGKGCGTQNIPGVYTKVQPYVEWIESIVWP